MKRTAILAIAIVSLCLVLTACGQTQTHTHTWTEATCTAPKTCSECGETEGEALGHTWQPATCTEPEKCSVCGETQGEALGHTWQPATYDAPETCSVCGETQGEKLMTAFEESGIPVGETPETVTVTAWSYKGSSTQQLEAKVELVSYSVEPSADREGYKTIRFAYKYYFEFSYSNVAFEDIYLWDLYTGYKLGNKWATDDKVTDYEGSFQVNGEDVNVYWTEDIDWSKRSYSGKTASETCLYTFVIDVPEDYDGLVCGVSNAPDYDAMSTHQEGGYFLSELGTSCYFFRLG